MYVIAPRPSATRFTERIPLYSLNYAHPTVSPSLAERGFIKGQKYTLLSHRENLTLEGKKSLKLLLAANKRLHTAYLLKESFGQLWSYHRLLDEVRDCVVALSGPPHGLTMDGFAEEAYRRELERLKRAHRSGESFRVRSYNRGLGVA